MRWMLACAIPWEVTPDVVRADSRTERPPPQHDHVEMEVLDEAVGFRAAVVKDSLLLRPWSLGQIGPDVTRHTQQAPYDLPRLALPSRPRGHVEHIRVYRFQCMATFKGRNNLDRLFSQQRP